MPDNEKPLPDLWWSLTLGVLTRRGDDIIWTVEDGDFNLWFRTVPEDAVRLAIASPEPRVWFSGDTVPADVRVMQEDGSVNSTNYDDDDGEEWDNYLGTVVEVTLTEDRWHAIVDRARAERKEKMSSPD